MFYFNLHPVSSVEIIAKTIFRQVEKSFVDLDAIKQHLGLNLFHTLFDESSDNPNTYHPVCALELSSFAHLVATRSLKAGFHYKRPEGSKHLTVDNSRKFGAFQLSSLRATDALSDLIVPLFCTIPFDQGFQLNYGQWVFSFMYLHTASKWWIKKPGSTN